MPDKLAIILTSPSVGDIREAYSGGNGFVQTDLGLDETAPPQTDTAERDLFSAVNRIRDASSFRSLTYLGVFDQDGRKYHLVEGKMPSGYVIELKFDVGTKLLVSFTSVYSTMSLGDYRKVGNIMLPFNIDAAPAFSVKLSEIKLNPDLDDSYFRKKEHCFDKPLPGGGN